MLPDLFKHREEELREKILQGEAPFISLYEHHILPNTRKLLHTLFAQDHTILDIQDSFTNFPALTSSYLTSAIGNSETETMQIWNPVEQALGLKPLNASDRSFTVI
jgi:hypothetical protein